MLENTYTTYRPTLIPSLVFIRKEDCEIFERALNDMLESEDWKSEWFEITYLIYKQERSFSGIMNYLKFPRIASNFEGESSPTIGNLLRLATYAVKQTLDNENVEEDNIYYPVLCFLAFVYK